MTKNSALEEIHGQIMWNRLISVVEEQAQTLIRTDSVETPIFRRAALEPGSRIACPALILEDQTTTVVGTAFDATVNALSYVVLERRR